jgi:hypothetical protein
VADDFSYPFKKKWGLKLLDDLLKDERHVQFLSSPELLHNYRAEIRTPMWLLKVRPRNVSSA